MLGTMPAMTRHRELEDSSALLGDHEALRARIAADGYVFVRGLLDAGTMADVGRHGLATLQHAGWTESGDDPVGAPPRLPVRAVRMRHALADPGYRRILADEGFARVPFVAPLSELMEQVLGPGGFCYPLRVPRVVYPAEVVPRQPGSFVHKDYKAVQDMFTCWVPLGRVPTTLGGLAVLPGSQTSASVRPRPLARLEPGWRTTDYQPGDVLVFHCMTTHAALPNREHRMRFSAEYRWQLAEEPAPRRLVFGPRGREIGSQLFGHCRWWRSVAGGLTVFDDGGDGAGPRLPAPPSRFVRLSS